MTCCDGVRLHVLCCDKSCARCLVCVYVHRTLDALQLSMMEQEVAARATLQAQIASDNAALRALKAAQLQDQQEAEAAGKQAELAAAGSDPWLNEDPQQAASVLSPVRVRAAEQERCFIMLLVAGVVLALVVAAITTVCLSLSGFASHGAGWLSGPCLSLFRCARTIGRA